MCGIVGYVGDIQAEDILIDALKKLEYRGYDSAGIAVLTPDGIKVVKSKGEIRILQEKLKKTTLRGTMGIAHTRWATHGIPSDRNAHPHTDCTGKLALVHNGIIENHQKLKAALIERGHTFQSETDSEVIVHLIEERYHTLRESSVSMERDDALLNAVLQTIPLLEGSFAIVVAAEDTDYLVGVREKSPLVIGVGSHENFLSSDVSPLLKYTTEVVYLNDGEVVRLDKERFRILDRKGNKLTPQLRSVEWRAEDAEKGGYEHFMLKEIHEQVGSLHNSFTGMILENFPLSGMLKTLVPYLSAIEIIGCGTSYNAGVIGKYFIESLTRIPVTVSFASEYRYSAPVELTPLVIAISQSGETADTLAAVREARRRGSITIAITNVIGSTITRDADFTLYTRAGPEIGVAATKTFTAQVMVLCMFGLRIAEAKGINTTALGEIENALRGVPRLVQKVIDNPVEIKKAARFLSKFNNIFFIGRGINYPTAVEGALKLKEISYIHAEAYPAGELKHGPLALLSQETPVVAISALDHVREKLYSNVGEVCARKAPVILVAEEGDENATRYTDMVLRYPHCLPEVTPIPASVVLQLLAYYTARERNCSIDKPRNLAKSVTVE